MRKSILQLMTVFMIELMIFLPIAFVDAFTISSVQPTDITDSFAKINWQTDEPSTSTVNYGTTKPPTETKTDSKKVKNHSILLTNLNKNTPYHFSVTSSNNKTITDNNSNAFYTFTTSVNDTTPPYIDIAIPEYATSERITIAGKTEPLTKLFLYINGEIEGVHKPEKTGMGIFSWPSIELSIFKIPNEIKIQARDLAGNINTKTFNVIVDRTTPKISLVTLPTLTNISEFIINGTVSENSTVEILLNNASIFKQETSSFSVKASLEEGINKIKITAIDKAGNSAQETRAISLVTQPPTIENIKPKTGAFFYEGAAKTTIEGNTTPNATVRLYIVLKLARLEAKPDYETRADAKGHFRIKVDLEKIDFFQVCKDECEIECKESRDYLSCMGVCMEGCQKRYVKEKEEEQTVDVYITATGPTGLTSQEKVSYKIGTCYSGNMAWSIDNLIEYQSPSLLSPERLAEGTDFITFVLNLSYQWYGTNPVIKNVRFDRGPACRATALLKDPRYNYSCSILPASPATFPNEKKTLWYVRYDLRPLKGMDTFSKDLWKDLTRAFIFPLRITIEYTHEIEGNRTPEYQKKCIDLAYAIDTSRIDPRKVLPDWLRKDLMSGVNSTIKALNKIIPKVEKILDYAVVGCAVGFALKVITVIYRRIQSSANYITDKVKLPGDPNKCPAPGSRTVDVSKANAKALANRTQVELTNPELKLRCPLAYSAWQTEAKAYKAYRWACDRVLCSGTAAGWTSKKELKDVREQIIKGLRATQKHGIRGEYLKKDDEWSGTAKRESWEYGEKHYAFFAEKDDVIKEPGITYHKLYPIDKYGNKIEITPITAIKKAGAYMIEEPEEKNCTALCKEKGFKGVGEKDSKEVEVGKCIDPNDPKTFEGIETDVENAIFHTKNCAEKKPKQICYCFTRRSKDQEKATPTDTTEKWDYRDNKIKRSYYNRNVYYKDRDQSACFGQDEWFDKNSPYLDPRDTMPAFQCLCISQILNRLKLLKSILTGMYACLKQIENTGKANTGFCKEFFTIYLCKWLAKTLTSSIERETPWFGIGKDKPIGDYVRAGTTGIFGGIQEATTDLMEDYEDANLENYLGLGTHTMAEKVCLGALTGDWGIDFKGLMDVVYESPYRTSAMAPIADREYLTWNPSTLLSTYEYRASWMIAPGCDIDSYTVNLACVTDYERDFSGVKCKPTGKKPSAGGCDCSALAQAEAGTPIDQSKPGPTELLYRGARISQGVFEDRSAHKVVSKKYRFDHVKIELTISDPKKAKKCIKEGHLVGRRGVFYSPITDVTTTDIFACRFNPMTGTFICDLGKLLWEARGKAYFGKPEYQDTFYLDDELKIDKLPIYIQGKKQCLYVKIRNELNEELNTLYETYEPDKDDPSKIILKIEKDLMLLKKEYYYKIRDVDFGKHESSYKIKERWYDVHEERVSTKDREIREGDYSIYFKDTEDDEKEIATHIKGVDEARDDWEDLTTTNIYHIGGMAFKFIRPKVPKNSRCEGEGEVPCQEYKFLIKKERPRWLKTKSQTWKIHLELRHAPGEDNSGDCSASKEEDLIGEQFKDIEVTVIPKTLAESKRCKLGGTVSEKNMRACSCNKDEDITDPEDCIGDTNQNNRIDEGETAYCYKKDTEYRCHKYPKCLPGDDENEKDCDCNMNDKLGDKKGQSCENKYCWDTGVCEGTPQPLIAVKIDLLFSDHRSPIAVGQCMVNTAKKRNIPVEVIFGIAAHESKWGKSKLAKSPYYNLFGIKGKGYEIETRECLSEQKIKEYKNKNKFIRDCAPKEEFKCKENEKCVWIKAEFKKYNSYCESIEDLGKKLVRGSYGTSVLRYINQPEEMVKGFLEAGYSTDPGWADNVIKHIKVLKTYKITK